MSRRISVAFSNIIDPNWLAGGQYLYNLLYAIKDSGVPIEAVLMVASGTSSQSYAMLNGLFERIIEFPSPLPFWMQNFPNAIKNRLPRLLSNEDHEFYKNLIDAQFILVGSGRSFRTPTMCWIPDFQYLHFPDFFSDQELTFRSKIYLDSAYNSTSVVLSSQHAFSDLQRIAPATVGKAHILNFVAQVGRDIYNADPNLITQHYRFPEKFFFLPNQFWQHKNHEVVLKALALVKNTIPDLTVVCSGGVYDHRKPGYFDSILQQIAVLGIQDNIRILGSVPRAHFWQMMRGSLAVLQPSLFEGWSTSVEEVKSLGKSIIVSDIPVHREQNPMAAYYFDPHKPVDLAEKLLTAYREMTPGPEWELENTAREQLRERTRTFAEEFYKITIEAIEGKIHEKNHQLSSWTVGI